jgi:hypothetical protein
VPGREEEARQGDLRQFHHEGAAGTLSREYAASSPKTMRIPTRPLSEATVIRDRMDIRTPQRALETFRPLVALAFHDQRQSRQGLSGFFARERALISSKISFDLPASRAILRDFLTDLMHLSIRCVRLSSLRKSSVATVFPPAFRKSRLCLILGSVDSANFLCRLNLLSIRECLLTIH